MNKEKNSADIFKEVLDDLGFSGYKPHQMTNSDYWLCTTKAMEVYAEYTASLKSSPTDEEIEKHLHGLFGNHIQGEPHTDIDFSRKTYKEGAKWARDYQNPSKSSSLKEDDSSCRERQCDDWGEWIVNAGNSDALCYEKDAYKRNTAICKECPYNTFLMKDCKY